MRIAVFHQFLDNIGGAELVTLVLARELNADIYTTNVDWDKIHNMGFSNIKIYSLGKIPKNPPYRHQIVYWKFRFLNLREKYDFYIVSGDWAISGLVNNKPNLWYIHSPLNEIYQFKDFIKNQLPYWQKPIYELWVRYIREKNKKYIKHAKKLICNSYNTKNRIKRYFNREAIVINPPIETLKYKDNKSEDYWLSVNRLAIHKRIDIQLLAFSKLPNENLVIVGSYEKGAKHFEGNFKYLKKLMKKNIQIKSWVSQDELIELYSRCKGFITTAQDEDFGMTPLEAMASGKPVIACNEGGYKETIINGETGMLIDNINPDKLANAVRKMSIELKKNPNKYKEACIKRAKEFDTSIFVKKIKGEIGI